MEPHPTGQAGQVQGGQLRRLLGVLSRKAAGDCTRPPGLCSPCNTGADSALLAFKLGATSPRYSVISNLVRVKSTRALVADRALPDIDDPQRLRRRQNDSSARKVRPCGAFFAPSPTGKLTYSIRQASCWASSGFHFG